jgi:hypothetical protein
MGLGIAFVASLRAKLPVFIHDRSHDQIQKSLGLMDKLLKKDVSKGKLSQQEADEGRQRVKVVDSMDGLKDVDMCVEVRHLTRPPLSASMSNEPSDDKGSIRIPPSQILSFRISSRNTSTRRHPSIQHLLNQHHQNSCFGYPAFGIANVGTWESQCF